MCRACTCDSVRGTSISKLHYTCSSGRTHCQLQRLSMLLLLVATAPMIAGTSGVNKDTSCLVQPLGVQQCRSGWSLRTFPTFRFLQGSCLGNKPRRQAKFRNKMLTWPKTAPAVTHAAQATVVESRSQHHSAGYCGRKRRLTA